MGEAKRRRDSASKPVPYRHPFTNELRTGRNAGDPVAFLNSIAEMVAADKRGEKPAAKVPCDGCTTCCYHDNVDVHPEDEDPEDLAHLDIVRAADGTAALRKRDDGACVHLGPTGCTVYHHRPRACRSYDCRLPALVGMVDTYDGDRHSPVWLFSPHTQYGRDLKEAMFMLGIVHQSGAKRKGEPASWGETFKFAFEHKDEMIKMLDYLRSLPPDELAGQLGFDPRKLTKDSHRELFVEMTKGLNVL